MFKLLNNLFSAKKTGRSLQGKKTQVGDYQTTNCISHQYQTLDIPREHFRDLLGMNELKNEFVNAVKEIRQSWSLQSETRKNGILLHGEPGNGKTLLGRMLAGSYEIPYFEIKASTITSQWVGETARAIRESFDFVKRNSPCVLMLDEVDSFISQLGKASSEDKRDVRNTFLTELVDIRQHSVFVVATTNYFQKLDSAAIREGRFDYKIEVRSPDYAARYGLLKKFLSNSLVDDNILQIVAKRYSGFNTKRIISIGEYVAKVTRDRPAKIEDFSVALRSIQGSKGNALRDVMGLQDLTFNDSVRDEINQLVSELQKVDQLLLHGASVFKGALFVGPAGTGKTALAKAIAKDSGWAFLEVAGPDLLGNLERIDEIYREALALRPCVIFIDEASELLAERTGSAYAATTNKLLTVIDGFGEDVPDVVFLAATNHGTHVDPAIARRLHRRIDFEHPDIFAIQKLVCNWISKNKVVSLPPSEVVDRVSKRLAGRSSALINASLDTAYKKCVLKAIQRNCKPAFDWESVQ